MRAFFVLGLSLFLPFALPDDGNSDKLPEGWSALDVPGAWQDVPGGKFGKYHGIAWYRCFVKVPAAWKGDDLTLTVQKIDDCHEAYFNGIKIGGQGSFPPNYQNGYSEQS